MRTEGTAPPRLEGAPARARVSIGLLGAAGFLVTANVRAIDPLLPKLANDFATSVGQAALIVSAYAVPYGLCQLLYGPLGDRLGKLRVMAAALVAFALGTAGCAFAPNLPALTALRLLTGAAAAALIPLSLALIGDNFPYSERQAALARYLTSTALGQILGTALGGIFGEFLSWRGLFLFSAVAALGTSAALGRAARDAPATAPPPESSFRTALKPYGRIIELPAARVVFAAAFVEGIFLFSGFSYLGAFLRERHGLPYLAIGFILAGSGLGGVIYSRIAGRLVRRLGERGLILLGGGAICACYVALALSPSWPPFIPLTVALGLSTSFLHGTLQTRATELAPAARGTAVALFAFSLFLGQGLGAAILGAIVNGRGYPTALVLVGGATGLLALCLVFAVRRPPGPGASRGDVPSPAPRVG